MSARPVRQKTPLTLFPVTGRFQLVFGSRKARAIEEFREYNDQADQAIQTSCDGLAGDVEFDDAKSCSHCDIFTSLNGLPSRTQRSGFVIFSAH